MGGCPSWPRPEPTSAARFACNVRTLGGGGARVMVQVAGEVRRPGVYELPAGARVEQAVERAGGLTRRADQVGVNLVARVQDGQQVIVPRRGGGGAVAASGAGSAGTGAGGGASGAPAGPIRLSSATAERWTPTGTSVSVPAGASISSSPRTRRARPDSTKGVLFVALA